MAASTRKLGADLLVTGLVLGVRMTGFAGLTGLLEAVVAVGKIVGRGSPALAAGLLTVFAGAFMRFTAAGAAADFAREGLAVAVGFDRAASCRDGAVRWLPAVRAVAGVAAAVAVAVRLDFPRLAGSTGGDSAEDFAFGLVVALAAGFNGLAAGFFTFTGSSSTAT